MPGLRSPALPSDNILNYITNVLLSCYTHLGNRVHLGDDQASEISSCQGHAQAAAQRCQLTTI
jgi:hypothetical protein